LIQEIQADNARNVVILQKQTGKIKRNFAVRADYNAAKNIAALAVSIRLLLSAKELSKVA
jgi:hypothetical protein